MKLLQFSQLANPLSGRTGNTNPLSGRTGNANPLPGRTRNTNPLPGGTGITNPLPGRTKNTNPLSPSGKNFLCDQNLELPLFLRFIFVKFFSRALRNFKNLLAVRLYT